MGEIAADGGHVADADIRDDMAGFGEGGIVRLNDGRSFDLVDRRQRANAQALDCGSKVIAEASLIFFRLTSIFGSNSPCLMIVSSAVPPATTLASLSLARIAQASDSDLGSTKSNRRIESHPQSSILHPQNSLQPPAADKF